MKIKIISKERIEGDLIFEGHLKFTCDCYVTGRIQAGWSIKSDGSIQADGSIKSGGSIKACGSIKSGESIEACGSIEADGSIKADGSIQACGSIKSDGSIEAGGSIQADGSIEADGSIKSGESIEAGWYIFSFIFSIEFKTYLKTSRLPFWRNFWAEMLPFEKWKSEILNEKNCWPDYRKMISKEDAKKICAWEGWHWILRAQLEMFFELKEKYVIKDIKK